MLSAKSSPIRCIKIVPGGGASTSPPGTKRNETTQNETKKMEKIIYNKFSSMNAFSKFLADRQPCGAFKDEFDLASVEESESRTEFTGTKSYEDADSLLKFGDKDSFKKLSSGRVKVDDGDGVSQKIYHNVVGCCVDLGAYLAGAPNCMIDVHEENKGAKTIKVFYSSSVGYSVDAKEVAIVANKFFNAIKKIEQSGIDVELYVGSVNKMGNETAAFSVLLKRCGEQISLYKCAYPIINPSFNRRHSFRYREVCGVKNKKWVDTYGYTVFERREMEKIINMPCFNYYSCENLSVDEIIKAILSGMIK
jgi:hypothetical protein